ncbi:MAG: DisA protein [Desulfobacteraceae bacterium]|nr:DisA protein [Desulfobacteraceae bacterium]
MESFLNLFSGFRWQDALDILLNTYILFRLYVLFRGTNVFRGLLAIGVLWGVSQTALTLGLIVTNWAIQGVIAVAALIVIIVFRNEISGVIQTKNLKSFLWKIPQYQLHTPLNIIAKSVNELAQKKIGALIVLPLKQGLDSIVQGETSLKSKLSQEMLVNVFWPGSPLHDGAAIIQGDQIFSAGALLPLSKKNDLPPFFGTRHRAAAGIAELTDAMVIVVSEERGEITVFKENNIYFIKNILDLEKLLQKYAGDDSTKRRLKHQTLELASVGLISLFCITGIWASFSKGMETFAEYEIPVEFINPAQKMEIVSSSASNVKLLISGARPLVQSIKPEQINIKLNLSQSLVGNNKLAITQNNIQLPPGIRLKKIDPSELMIKLDTLIEKELPIQPNWTGKLPSGLVMKKAMPVPETIKVTGGGLALKDISTIFTEELSLNNLTESGTYTTALVLDPPSIKLEDEQNVQIQYVIAKNPAQ